MPVNVGEERAKVKIFKSKDAGIIPWYATTHKSPRTTANKN